MSRLPVLGSICVIALCCGALPACGQQDETQALLAKCGDPPPNQVDSCLEQARVLDETDPSKDSKALVAHLIQIQVEARSNAEQVEAPPPPPDDSTVAPPDPPPTSTDLGGSYDPPPQSQDETAPAIQGNPSDADQNDTDAPAPPPDNNIPLHPYAPSSQDNGQPPPPDNAPPPNGGDGGPH